MNRMLVPAYVLKPCLQVLFGFTNLHTLNSVRTRVEIHVQLQTISWTLGIKAACKCTYATGEPEED